MAEKDPRKKDDDKKAAFKYPAALVAVVAVILIAAAVYLLYNSAPVSFSTFKSNFQNANRVAITATYYNNSQYADESPCMNSIIQVVAHTRKASTIDFFFIDASNNTCTYPVGTVGGQITVGTSNASRCLGIARGEPGIFLNYSSGSGIVVTPYRLYVHGNSTYMASCPIAIEMA
ncbi:MAG: hypothetical protein KGI00_04670 [Candidatus Micrarchaeota archaeon]|nr:hypothetical protein [Candidatus Micrarchaeota archaeon]MDE1849994.1 hypothetical protein [Candidatus Micrarchaeota archaeon]